MSDNFSAVAMCPRCECVSIHPFRMANTKANASLVKKVNGKEIHMWGAYSDPADAIVMRQCKCGKEWGQK